MKQVQDSTKNEIPGWLQAKLKPEDLSQVAQAIGQAEEKTYAEIVPMIVQSSSHVQHLGWEIGFALWSLALLGLLLFQNSEGLMLLGSLLAFPLGMILARSMTLQRIMIPRQDQWHQVHARAEIEFHRLHLENTSRQSAVLIFISWMERKIVVLSDHHIASLVPENTWSEVVKHFMAHMQAGNLKEGLLAALQGSGTLLANKLPAPKHETNEIPNQLVIKN